MNNSALEIWMMGNRDVTLAYNPWFMVLPDHPSTEAVTMEKLVSVTSVKNEA